MIFIGPLYQPEMEKALMAEITGGRMSNAANQYQADLLSGLIAAVHDLEIINVLPVGTWPKHYRKFILQDRQWQFDGKNCFDCQYIGYAGSGKRGFGLYGHNHCRIFSGYGVFGDTSCGLHIPLGRGFA